MRQHLLVIAAALVAFGVTAAGSFHFDDYALFNDPAITSDSGWWEVWRPVQTRPLTYFTFWMNYRAGGATPLGFHVTSLAVHLAACAMLLTALRRLVPGRPALIAALIFAVHPIQTEAVAYVFARATLLAGLFCIVSLWLWANGNRWLAAAAFAAALLAKEECAAFPFVPAALSLVTGERGRRTLIPVGVMLALAAAAGLRVIAVAATLSGSGAGPGSTIGPLEYVSVQGVAIVRYLSLLFAPWGFTVDTALAPPAWMKITAWVLILVTVAVLSRWREPHQPGFWFIAGLVLLTPASSVFPANDLAADRRMYLPMIAFSTALSLAAARWRTPAAAAALCVLTLVSIRYSFIWQTERSLWSEAVRRAPAKIRPRIQLARALPAAEALTVLNDAESIAPATAAVASEQGRVYLELGRPQDALHAFGRALAANPGDASAVNNRGVVLASLGQVDAARMDFERALKINPCLFDARLNLKRLGAPPPPGNCRFTPAQQAQISGR